MDSTFMTINQSSEPWSEIKKWKSKSQDWGKVYKLEEQLFHLSWEKNNPANKTKFPKAPKEFLMQGFNDNLPFWYVFYHFFY